MGVVRKTKSVKAILNTFAQGDDAISVVHLIDLFQDQMNRTTVYRILERLEEEGVLHSFIGKDGRRWYAKCKNLPSGKPIGTHPHFQCKSCGKVECLPFEVEIPTLPNYKVDAVEFLIVGECGDCRNAC